MEGLCCVQIGSMLVVCLMVSWVLHTAVPRNIDVQSPAVALVCLMTITVLPLYFPAADNAPPPPPPPLSRRG